MVRERIIVVGQVVEVFRYDVPVLVVVLGQIRDPLRPPIFSVLHVKPTVVRLHTPQRRLLSHVVLVVVLVL